MDLREEEQKKNNAFKKEKEKKRHFRIVKLEERVAPGQHNTNQGCSSATDSIGSVSFY